MVSLAQVDIAFAIRGHSPSFPRKRHSTCLGFGKPRLPKPLDSGFRAHNGENAFTLPLSHRAAPAPWFDVGESRNYAQVYWASLGMTMTPGQRHRAIAFR